MMVVNNIERNATGEVPLAIVFTSVQLASLYIQDGLAAEIDLIQEFKMDRWIRRLRGVDLNC